MPLSDPCLSLEQVGHAYLGRAVLDGIAVAVPAGAVVAPVGPSGCGKSTLAHIAVVLWAAAFLVWLRAYWPILSRLPGDGPAEG
ncbi:hypothetical protein [Azospirillum sp. ST 5-10]|uniref:hypothetical protein n=1 Tax=unclassified Azospirillum TaxID=2630922 RepID=UPI003F4A3686